MTPAVEDEPKHVHITINLPALLGGLLVSLQRLIDLVSIGLTGAAKVNEKDYEHPPQFAAFQIAADHRLPLAKASEEFQTWCLKNSFTEAIDNLSAFLEQSRTVAAMYRLGTPCTGMEFDKALNQDRKKFHKLGLPDKITHLREDLGIQSQFEEHVLSLNRARNCLVHRLGRVSPEDVDESGFLTLTWHALDLILVDKANKDETILTKPVTVKSESDLVARIGSRRKQFNIGERILFDQDQHKHTMLTFYVFALGIAQSIENCSRPTTAS